MAAHPSFHLGLPPRKLLHNCTWKCPARPDGQAEEPRGFVLRRRPIIVLRTDPDGSVLLYFVRALVQYEYSYSRDRLDSMDGVESGCSQYRGVPGTFFTFPMSQSRQHTQPPFVLSTSGTSTPSSLPALLTLGYHSMRHTHQTLQPTHCA